MTRTISLNSTESLPIPPRTSSRAQLENQSQPMKPSPLRGNGATPRDASPYSITEKDGAGSSGSRTPPSPSMSPRSDGSFHKRKAVPPYLPPPSPAADLPADHPFSVARNGMRPLEDRRTASIRSGHSGNSGSDPGTPGWREEKDLFFGQKEDNQVTALPPPPRKSNVRRSPAPPHSPQVPQVPQADAVPSIDAPITLEQPVVIETSSPEPNGEQHRRGTFAGGLNIDVPGLNPEAMTSQISTATSAGYETARSGPSSPMGSGESTPTATHPKPKLTPETEEYYDRPLPPIPTAASSVSLDLSAMLAAGPTSSLYSRSDSVTSRPGPTTPRLSNGGRDSPVIRGADTDAASSINSGKGFSALGGKKFPWQKKKSKAEKEDGHLHGDEDDGSFSVSRVPSQRALWEAGTHFVRDENGGLVYFGDLFPKWDRDSSQVPTSHTKAEFAASKSSKTSLPYPPASSADDGTPSDPSRPPPRTVMFFIRFFWCGQCQDYLFASVSQLDPEALAKANIRVVIISCGSWKFIKPYRKLTRCPFPVYVDGPRKLYKLLGMTKQTMDMGPMLKKDRPAYNQHSIPVQIALTFSRAPRMPLNSSPGSITQLGGEFILEPGFKCSFAHRMTNFSNHMEAPDILRLAGCAAPTKDETKQLKLAAEEEAELERLQKEMNSWRSDRESELDRIRRKKAERRGVEYKPISAAERVALNLDATPAFGPDNSGRRESDVSAISIGTVKADQDSSAEALDVSVDEFEPRADEDDNEDMIEVLDGEDEEDEVELDARFEQAMKFEEEAKGRFESGRGGVQA